MNYKKIEKDNYRLHLIETKKFKTITIDVNYKRKIKKEDMTIRRLLVQTLLESSLKYPSRRALEMETEDLYALSVSGDNYVSGEYDVMNFTSTFLNEHYTEPGMNKRSLEFLFQIILNPNIKNNEFKEESFLISKRVVEDDIKCLKDYPKSYSVVRMLEKMDSKSPLSYRNCGYLKDLKKITTEDLYNYYLDAIKNDILDIVIIGDIKKEEVVPILDNYFSLHNKNMESESHFLKPISNVKKVKNIKEKLPINQSHLVIGCTFDKLDDFELRYVLNVYSFILGGSGDSLLFKTVREKNSLCYNIQSNYNILGNVLTIKAGIDSKNAKKTISLIEEILNQMKNGDFAIEEIEKAKMIFKNSCIEIVDSPKNIINTYLSSEYLKSDLLEEKIKKIDKVTKEMVVALANKIHINTIYLLEGEPNGKEIS
jgi:predicted Zn-dependent peptidase